MTSIFDGAHFKNPFALKDGRLVHVDSVQRGKECGCSCPGCDGALVAAQGEIRAHYFRHDAVLGNCVWYSNTGGAEETEWHRAAKLSFLGVQFISGFGFRRDVFVTCLDGTRLDEIVFVPFEQDRIAKVEIEKAVDDFRPDVVLTFESGRVVWVEVTVSSKPSQRKIDYLIEQKKEAVEVRVSRTLDTVTSAEAANSVVSNASQVDWLFHREGFALVDEARIRLLAQKQVRDKEWLENERVRNEAENAARAAELQRKREADDLLRTQQRVEAEKPPQPTPGLANGEMARSNTSPCGSRRNQPPRQ